MAITDKVKRARAAESEGLQRKIRVLRAIEAMVEGDTSNLTARVDKAAKDFDVTSAEILAERGRFW
jgi:hypothetical protein